MLRLHDYEGSANGYKVRLLLAQLERAYELVPVEIFRGEAQTEAFLAMNPAGRVPVLEIAPGEALAESNAILHYLAEGTPYHATSRLDRARTLQWLSFEQDGIESTIGSVRYWKLTGRTAARGGEVAYRVASGERALQAMSRHLETRAWFVGETYGIADIALYAYSHLAPEAGFDMSRWPNVERWLERVEAQPRFVPGPAPYTAAAMVSTA